MSTVIPETHRDLIEGPILVTLATVMPNGTPHTTIIWCRFDGAHILFSSSEGGQKNKNMAHNPNVSLMALDPQNAGRYLEIRGVVESHFTDRAIEELNRITQLYTGKPSYYGHIVPQETFGQRVHVIFKIRPTRVLTHG
ncbi:MAG: PPOX class F420-dependent oxidoreductase [Chloroflexota bacterium]